MDAFYFRSDLFAKLKKMRENTTEDKSRVKKEVFLNK